MSRRFTTFFELLLLMAVVISLGLGVNWNSQPAALATQHQSTATLAPATDSGTPAVAQAETSVAPDATLQPDTSTAATPPPDGTPVTSELTTTLEVLPTSAVFGNDIPVEEGDAPLLVQTPGTINILLLGSDAAVDARYSRTDTILIASINPEMPSVSLLSIPRDLQVRIPDHSDDRINTAYELGYLRNYPGGGPAFLAVVLRKNFGVKIDHYVRVDFTGFVKAVETLGGVDVLVECELHDTFPDKTAASGKIDLDVYPGRVTLNGKQALMYARSRWSTTDFDRARRQQKVLRALLSKAKNSNLLQNALGLYQDFQENVDTDIGLASIPTFIDIAGRLDNLAIKNRVVTYPVLKAFTRSDGAMVLLPTQDTTAYIAEALSPPAGNRAQNRVRVEVYNASGQDDMEAVAAERLGWEGFVVMASDVLTETGTLPKTQIIDYTVTPKGSPISRLAGIFNVGRANIFSQPDPSSIVAARIVLGEDYNSCPRTAVIAGDVPLASDTELIPTSTPQP
ncbi:MAG: LCP family protein [Chloroflexi bacterium]|nr:LCP family protein [Chloroflexota bacterium]